MYKAIRFFTDLHDNNFAYHAGDTFPRDGLAVTADRITELSTAANKQGVPLIEEVRGAEETAETAAENPAVDEADKAAPVEDEPKKRGRKRKE